MTERVEWEVVDERSSASSGKQQWHEQQQWHGQQQDMRGTTRTAMHAMLGRWWKWKIAGTAIVSVLTLALFATLTGALVLLFAAGTLLTLAVRKLKHWLAGDRRPATPMKL